MFWGCLPSTTAVSGVPYMIDYGDRGTIVNVNVGDIIFAIENYLQNEVIYQKHVERAKLWSQQFTLEKFEREIENLLNEE